MITVSEAKSLILENCKTSKTEWLPLLQANGSVLSEPVYSPIDSPPFDQSSMDGYAFSFQNWDKKSALTITEEIQAGNFSARTLNSNEAVRIFTGAALPIGADTVIMQEKVSLSDNKFSVNDPLLINGSNVRTKGAQIKKGELALNNNQLLHPAGVSYLAGLGITHVPVYSKPVVSIIVTGKELIKPGNNLSEGSIYESNSIAVAAALQQLGITPSSIKLADDNEQEIFAAIRGCLTSDIIIITGGVSVGDYDLVPAALEKCGVKEVFHKVKQKPGKPMYFGVSGPTLIFGLPGNPAAVLCCFYQYIVPAISCYTKKDYFRKLILPLTDDFKKKPGLTYFMKGKVTESGVSVLSNQESYQLNSFALADCIITLEEEKEFCSKGEMVQLMMIN